MSIKRVGASDNVSAPAWRPESGAGTAANKRRTIDMRAGENLGRKGLR